MSSPLCIAAKLTAVRSEEKGPFDVTLSTPSRKTPVKSSFNGNGIVEERTEVLYDVDPEETLTLKLFDEGSEEEVKYVQIPVKSLTAEVTSTFLVHDGISVSITYDLSKGEKADHADKLDHFITTFGEAPKPWYLEAATLYSTLKHTLTRIFQSKLVIDTTKNSKAIQGAIAFAIASTEIIQHLTLYKRLFSQAEGEVLVNLLDAFISTHLEKFDNKTDNLRSQLASSLLRLKAVIKEHTEWVKESSSSAVETTRAKSNDALKLSKEKLVQLDLSARKFVDGVKGVVVSFKTPNDKLNSILSVVTTWYEQATAFVGDKFKIYNAAGKSLIVDYLNGKVTVDSSWSEIATAGTDEVLSLAQPYVHTAIKWSTPAITKALTFSKPFLSRALPLVSTVAGNVKQRVEANHTAGQLLKLLTEKSLNLIEASSAYAIPDDLADVYKESLKFE